VRRIGLTTAVAVVALAALVADALAGDSWVRREGRYFIAWVPTAKWTVSENEHQLVVGSPTSEATVEFDYAAKSPGPVSLPAVEARSLSRAAGYASVRVLGRSRPTDLGDGVTSEVVEFLATRLRDGVRVHGLMTAHSYSRFGQYGFGAYQQVAPAASWARWSPTLQTIQARLVVIGRGVG
jgi:hypothetical protein